MKINHAFLLLPAMLLLACDDDDTFNDIAPNNVPEAVRNSFAARFPNVTDLEWGKEKKGSNYEADFDVNGVDYSAQLDAAGVILRYKYDITLADLPAPIQTALSQNHAGISVDDAERLLEGSGEVVLYQVELDGRGRDRNLVYSASGQELTQPAYWGD